MNPPTQTLETILSGCEDEVKDVSLMVGWCMNVLSDIAWIQTIQKFNTITGSCINMNIEITTHKNKEPTEDRYSKRLKNWSNNPAEHEPGGR